MDDIVKLSETEFGMLWHLATAMLTDYDHSFPSAFAAAVKKRIQLVEACSGSGMPAGETATAKVYVCHEEGQWFLRLAPFD